MLERVSQTTCRWVFFCGFPMSKINFQMLCTRFALRPGTACAWPSLQTFFEVLSKQYRVRDVWWPQGVWYILNYMSQSYICWKWYVSNIIFWNLLWTIHRNSSWFRTYFKLRTVPVHHTRVIRLTLCIGPHHLKSLNTLKLPTIYINLWNHHVLRIQVVTYSNWQIQHLYIF